MSAAELHTILRADARRWPDHTDYWRFGPTQAALSVPATVPGLIDGTAVALLAMSLRYQATIVTKL
jgi:hypothetical protein